MSDRLMFYFGIACIVGGIICITLFLHLKRLEKVNHHTITAYDLNHLSEKYSNLINGQIERDNLRRVK